MVKGKALPDLADANGNPIPIQHAVQLRGRFFNGLYRVSLVLLETVSGPRYGLE